MPFRDAGFILNPFLDEGHYLGRRPASNGWMKILGAVLFCISILHHIESFCPKVYLVFLIGRVILTQHASALHCIDLIVLNLVSWWWVHVSHFPYLYIKYFLNWFFCISESLRWCLNKAIFVCYRSIISDIQRDNRIVSLSTRAGIRNTLVTILDQLQRCQKSLNEFLEVYKCTYVSKICLI